MLSWQVGAVKITRIVEMEIPVPAGPDNPLLPQATPETLRAIPWLYPNFVNEQDQMLLSIHALLVEAPGLRVVIDTCIGNDKPRGITGGRPLATGFLQSLAEAGCAPEDVDAVVCTHLHVDHVGWNTRLVDGKWVPTFPNARYLLGKIEFAHWTAEGGDVAIQLRDTAQRQVIGLDLVVHRQLGELRHQAPMAADSPFHQAGMRQPVQPAILAVAGRGSEYQRQPVRLARLAKPGFQRDDQLVGGADADETGNGNCVARANDRDGFGGRDDFIFHETA